MAATEYVIEETSLTEDSVSIVESKRDLERAISLKDLEHDVSKRELEHAVSKGNLELGISKGDLERAAPNHTLSLWSYLMADVDPAQTTAPLAAYCFMTGYVDVVSFSAIFVWCGFQTGNFAQLALALARLFETNPDLTFHKADQQALCSLISFNLGAFIGRIGDRVGAQKRIWLIVGTFIQALFTMASAIAFWKAGQPSISNARDDPAWTNTLTFVGLGFMSASLGVQGILGKRLNTQFGTTIVLTTVWVELMADPRLFTLRQRVKTRDHRLIAAIALFLGAFVSRSVLAILGTAATMGIAVGIRLLIALSWIFVPGPASRLSLGIYTAPPTS